MCPPDSGEGPHLDEVSVIIRPYDPVTDQACIYSTWRNSSYYGGVWPENNIPYSKYFFKTQTVLIRGILGRARVRIACLQDDPLTIIGYSVSTDKHLNFIYVKVDYRGKGLGAMLMPKDIETVTSELTKIGKVIVEKKKLKIKENDNGNDKSGPKSPKAA